MVLQSLGSVQSDITEAQLTVGSAKVTTVDDHGCQKTLVTASCQMDCLHEHQTATMFSVSTFCRVNGQLEHGL